jgi:hypothetical protein
MYLLAVRGFEEVHKSRSRADLPQANGARDSTLKLLVEHHAVTWYLVHFFSPLSFCFAMGTTWASLERVKILEQSREQFNKVTGTRRKKFFHRLKKALRDTDGRKLPKNLTEVRKTVFFSYYMDV